MDCSILSKGSDLQIDGRSEGCYTHIAYQEEVSKMARKKRSPIEELSRKGLTDQRYRNPLDRRAQQRKYKKDLRKLGEL